MMVCKKGGNGKCGDRISYGQKWLRVMKQLENLCYAWRKCLQYRMWWIFRAQVCFCQKQNFDFKIVPFLTFGHEMLWEHLKRKQPESIRKHKSGIRKESLLELEDSHPCEQYMSLQEKSPDRRKTMQASAVVQQCSKQITGTEKAEGKERWCKFFSTEAAMNR